MFRPPDPLRSERLRMTSGQTQSPIADCLRGGRVRRTSSLSLVLRLLLRHPVAAPQEAASSSSAPPAPAVVPGTPLPVPAARVPLPAELEEEAVRSAAYDGSSDSSSSSSSSSDEELVPDRPLKRERKRKADAELPRGKVKGNMMAVSCTIDVQEGDLKRLPEEAGEVGYMDVSEDGREVGGSDLEPPLLDETKHRLSS